MCWCQIGLLVEFISQDNGNHITDNLTGKIIKAAGPDGKISFKLTE